MHCRVAIADDVAETRALYRAILDEHERIEVVAEAADGLEALAAVHEYAPDVLLLDLAMPEIDGLQVLRALAQDEAADTRVVMLSGYAYDTLGHLMLEHGAVAFLEKGVDPEVLCQTVLDAAIDRGRAT